MEPRLKYFLLGLVVGGPFVAFLLLSLRGVGEIPNPDYVLVEKAAERIRCPDGALLEYSRWGESGYMVQCKLRHGAFVAAEGGRIVAEGEFSMGKSIDSKRTE